MATNAAAGAPRQLASAARAKGYRVKYTVPSTGAWDRIRRAFAIDPERSSGVPLNPQYRNPPPGANPPEAYDDPVTVPAGDIAENPYYRRDMRRSYPRLSVVNQADVVGLLSVGSAAKPKEDVLQIGDAGAKQLVQVKQEGEENGLAALFEKDKKSVSSIFGPNGLPPFPSGASRLSPEGGRKYVLDEDGYEGYPDGGWRDVVPVRLALGTLELLYIARTLSIFFLHFLGVMVNHLSIIPYPYIANTVESPDDMGQRISRVAHKGPHPLRISVAKILPPILDTMAANAEPNRETIITPQDIIFSCCVCHDTLSEVYDDGDHPSGMHYEPNQPAGRITKLYLTACAHVVCAEHLDGGGPPFHPEDQLPTAPCPYCKATKGDDSPQALFGIGLEDHNPHIPHTYFAIPAARLSQESPDTAALRFQYVSILRYATEAYRRRRKAERTLSEQTSLHKQENDRQLAETTRKMQLLGQALTTTESQLKRTRDWLIDLGQDVSSVDNALSSQNIATTATLSHQHTGVFDENASFSGNSIHGQLEQARTAQSTQRIDGPLRLAQGSAADLECLTGRRRPAVSSATQQSSTILSLSSNLRSLNTPHVQEPDHRPSSKRKRMDNVIDDQTSQRMTSRDAMPPPQLPPRRTSLHEPEFGVFTMDSLSPPRYRNPSRPPTAYGAALARGRNATESPATAKGHTSPLDFRPPCDGELDDIRLHQPIPQHLQRPIYAPSSVSPPKERLTLTPRFRAPSRGTGPGLLSHARSSSAVGMSTPRSSSTSTGSHRQQLGQSPFFGNRELPATPRSRESRTTTGNITGLPRFREGGTDTSIVNGTPRFHGIGMDPRIVNGLSFVEDPVVGSGGGRRRARR